MSTHFENKRLLELGRIQGLGEAVHLLREAGVAVEQQDCIHEAIDRAHIRLGDYKREPRSNAVRAERGM